MDDSIHRKLRGVSHRAGEEQTGKIKRSVLNMDKSKKDKEHRLLKN